MKTSTTETVPGFAPFKLVLEIETPAELDKIYFLFNYSPITTALNLDAEGDSIRELLNSKRIPHTSYYPSFQTYREKLEALVKKLLK